jgi:5-hydroxyisourate hydrolase
MNRGLPNSAQPGLRIRVFDTLRGAAAEGLRVELFRLGQGAEKRGSARLGADGALVDWPLDAGEYEVVVHLGEYYRRGIKDDGSRQPFLESVTLRLGIADPRSSCDLPLRIAPFGICMPGV